MALEVYSQMYVDMRRRAARQQRESAAVVSTHGDLKVLADDDDDDDSDEDYAPEEAEDLDDDDDNDDGSDEEGEKESTMSSPERSFLPLATAQPRDMASRSSPSLLEELPEGTTAAAVTLSHLTNSASAFPSSKIPSIDGASLNLPLGSRTCMSSMTRRKLSPLELMLLAAASFLSTDSWVVTSAKALCKISFDRSSSASRVKEGSCCSR